MGGITKQSGLILAIAVAIAAGCTPSQYANQADKSAYAMVAANQAAALGALCAALMWKRRKTLRTVASLLLSLTALLLMAAAVYSYWYHHRPQPEPVNTILFEGVTYARQVRTSPRPLVIHIVTVDLDAPGIGFLVTPPQPTAGRQLPARTTSQFLRRFGTTLQTHLNCPRCEGPLAESMTHCCWCGGKHRMGRDATKFAAECPRCHRGMKLDWVFCPWCYGAGFEPLTQRQLSDRRYTAKCGNTKCRRKVMMPFMRYCPWCHRKARKKWRIPGASEKCGHCGWGVVSEFWSYCPWCSSALPES